MGKFIDGPIYDWQQYIVNKNRSFDLNKFMTNKCRTTGAVALVTPLQGIMTECFCQKDGYYAHADTMKTIYSTIYEENINTNVEEMYTDLFTNDNNIRMRLCSSISVNIIYIPNLIADSQYNYLVNFNNMIKDIYIKNKTYFDKCPMQFTSNLSEDYSFNNIDSIVSLAYNHIGTFPYPDEYPIGTKINGYLSNSKGKSK